MLKCNHGWRDKDPEAIIAEDMPTFKLIKESDDGEDNKTTDSPVGDSKANS